MFGTINGLRLGRVPGIPVSITLPFLTEIYRKQVEWAEVNAAWGQTLLLLYTIVRTLDYKFEK